MAVTSRSAWVEPAYPVTGPAFEAHKVNMIVVHYGGVPWPEDRLRDSVRYWRDTQRSYVTGRGYSIGYNFGVGRDGSLWELRGFDFRNAANGSTWPGSPYYPWPGGNPNVSTVSIHCVLPLDGNLASGQLDGMRAMVRHIWDHLGREVPVIPHSDVVQTACPGDPMRALIASGEVYPPQVAPPPTLPPDEEDDMTALRHLWRDPRYGIWWLVDGCDIRPIRQGEWDALTATLPMVVEQHDQMLDTACHRNGLTRDRLPQ